MSEITPYMESLDLAQRQAIRELSDRLIKLGDANILALEVGDRAASEAMHFLVERAPNDLKGSWPLVIAWHRFGKAYEAADALGDTAEAVKAAKAQLDLATRRY